MSSPQDYKYWESRPRVDQSDWADNSTDWIKSYFLSQAHPHRKLIIDALSFLNAKSVVEFGCSAGPNLALIKEKLAIPVLAGIDANLDSIAYGKAMLPDVDFKHGTYLNTPWKDKKFDALIADACLMYESPDNIYMALTEARRLVKKGIIIVDRYNRSKLGVLHANNHIYARNYKLLLEDFGFTVKKQKLTASDWPGSLNWEKYGYIWIAYEGQGK